MVRCQECGKLRRREDVDYYKDYPKKRPCDRHICKYCRGTWKRMGWAILPSPRHNQATDEEWFEAMEADEKAAKAGDEEARKMFTCHGCPFSHSCPYAWDSYNKDGDCLADK